MVLLIEFAKKAYSFQAVAYVLTGPQSNPKTFRRYGKPPVAKGRGPPRQVVPIWKSGNHNERVRIQLAPFIRSRCHGCRRSGRPGPIARAVVGRDAHPELLPAVDADDPASRAPERPRARQTFHTGY